MMLHADARHLPLLAGCVQCVVTSPPYWGLRNYNVAAQIGLESTPDAYVASMVEVFREVWRVLRDDGTVWLNLGDSYATGAGAVGNCPGGGKQGERWAGTDSRGYRGARLVNTNSGTIARPKTSAVGPMTQLNRMPIDGLKPKDLVGIPWRVAFALQADGWYLRSDIIWHKPNPMPESVTDRPTKAHEYLFLLAKSARYAYDADAIAETATSFGRQHTTGVQPPKVIALVDSGHHGAGGDLSINYERQIRNRRSVWTISTMPYAGAHFATMPEALITPCILAGCPVGGLVLDPFIGSGTVGAVAERLGRRWVGCDLTYHTLARARTAQRGLFVSA